MNEVLPEVTNKTNTKKKIVFIVLGVVTVAVIVTSLMFFSNWNKVKAHISACEVSEVHQIESSKLVKIKLKNGKEISAFQPKLNDSFKLVFENASKCGPVFQINEK